MSNLYKLYSKKLRKTIYVKASTPQEALKKAMNGADIVIKRGNAENYDFRVKLTQGKRKVVSYYVVRGKQGNKSVLRILEIPKAELGIIDHILRTNEETTTEVNERNTITHSIQLDDGVFATIQLVMGKGKPFVVSFLNINGRTEPYSEPTNIYKRMWWFWYNGKGYIVKVVGV